MNVMIKRIILLLRTWILYSLIQHKSAVSSLIFSLIKRNRLVLMMYGDCHMAVYGDYLMNNHEIKKKYLLIGTYDIDYLFYKFSSFVSNASTWSQANVLLYNPNLPERSGVIELNDVLGSLPQETKKIRISTACFKGYFPQHTSKTIPNQKEFTWGDIELNRMIKNSEMNQNSMDALCSDLYFSLETVNKCWNDSMHMLELMEKNADIRIADYLKKNGKKRVLFYSVTHPTEEVFAYILTRLLFLLGCNDEIVDVNQIKKLNHHGEAVYPSVFYGLGIIDDWKTRVFQPGDRGTRLYNFNQYIEEYYNVGMRKKYE